MEANLRMEFNDTIDDDIFGSIPLGKLNDIYQEWLESEVLELRSQLTWRDVSEKPEVNDLYICKFHDNGESKIYMDTYEWRNGKWIVDYDEIIVGWMPIPKE